MQSYFAVAALVIQMVASYTIWPSKWNIPAHMALGFCVTAYVVPGVFTNVWDVASLEVTSTYMWINIAGAISVLFGTIIGFLVGNNCRVPYFLRVLFERKSDYLVKVRIDQFILMGILGMIVAYAVMGFIPMFADDPFSAKQFKGEYFEPYHRAAYLFRFSFSVLVACLPLSLVMWRCFDSKRSFLLSAVAIFLISVSLARASTALGIITFLGLMAASSRKWFVGYLVFVIIIYPLGSAGYLLLGLVLGVEKLTSIYAMDSIFDIVASGSPDIYDQLTFLSGFLNIENFTYGRTFFGGLIPGNYIWNPSVWTITYNNLGADISDTVSGGLRFSVALWGYASFGWIGVFMVPFTSGILNGYFVSFLKRLPFDKSIVGASLVISLYITLGKQMNEFYMLSIHSIPSIAAVLFICFAANNRINKIRIF